MSSRFLSCSTSRIWGFHRYVEGELDRHHPARVLVREATTADDYRAAGRRRGAGATTLERARRLPEAKLQERVNGE
jgi:hypothetical protein